MNKNLFKILFFVVTSFVFAVATDAGAWPKNLRYSFQLEIFRNPGLQDEDLRYMAAAILIANQGLSRDAALAHVQVLSMHEVKDLLKQDFTILYYEIPLEVLRAKGKFVNNQAEAINNHQLFNKDGKIWVRWFVHPLHERSEIEQRFSQYKKSGGFRGLLTSSRSMLIEDLTTGEYWSLKVSLSRASGMFNNKAYASRQAQFHFQMSTIIRNDQFLRNRFFLEDSFIAYLEGGLDEGQIVRSLEPHKVGEQIYTFATLYDPKIALKLSRANGYGNNWMSFISEKVVPDIGVISGHLYEKYGLIHNSLHSQNITVAFSVEGRFLGVRFRDPDFNVDIDKYRKVFGPEAAQAYGSVSNIRDHSRITVDFSVMNGLYDLAKFVPKDEIRFFYQKMGSEFVTAFLKQVAELRGNPMSLAEIKKRANDSTIIQSSDAYGIRQAIAVSGPEVERYLNPDEVIERSANVIGMKKSITSPGQAKELIETQLATGSVALGHYRMSELLMGWDLMVKELQEGKQNSVLLKILKDGNGLALNRLVVVLNTNPQFQSEKFMMTLFDHYPEILSKRDIAFYFNGHRDPHLLNRFLMQAPLDSVKRLLVFADVNGLFTYPESTLARFVGRVGAEELNKMLNLPVVSDSAKFLSDNRERILPVIQKSLRLNLMKLSQQGMFCRKILL